MEVSVIQQIVQLGIEREELRDEILVQCMRQLTANPHPEQVQFTTLVYYHPANQIPHLVPFLIFNNMYFLCAY